MPLSPGPFSRPGWERLLNFRRWEVSIGKTSGSYRPPAVASLRDGHIKSLQTSSILKREQSSDYGQRRFINLTGPSFGDHSSGYAWLFATPLLTPFLFRASRSAPVAREALARNRWPATFPGIDNRHPVPRQESPATENPGEIQNLALARRIVSGGAFTV